MLRLHTVAYIAVIIAVVAALSGCETMVALGTGKAKRADLAYVARASTTFSDISGITDDRDPEECYTFVSPQWHRAKIWKKLASADSWLEKNLW